MRRPATCCLYLQENGLLHRYYDEFSSRAAADPTGYKTLVRVLGGPDMVRFEKQWQAWALALEARVVEPLPGAAEERERPLDRLGPAARPRELPLAHHALGAVHDAEVDRRRRDDFSLANRSVRHDDPAQQQLVGDDLRRRHLLGPRDLDAAVRDLGEPLADLLVQDTRLDEPGGRRRRSDVDRGRRRADRFFLRRNGRVSFSIWEGAGAGATAIRPVSRSDGPFISGSAPRSEPGSPPGPDGRSLGRNDRARAPWPGRGSAAFRSCPRPAPPATSPAPPAPPTPTKTPAEKHHQPPQQPLSEFVHLLRARKSGASPTSSLLSLSQ